MSAILDSNQPREQAVFRCGYSATEHIPVNQVVEEPSEYNKPMCIVFIDYEKAINILKTSLIMQNFINYVGNHKATSWQTQIVVKYI